MNNRFKFRVWDFTIKRFDTEIYQAGEQFGHPSSCDWIAQQYTGLTDINDKVLLIVIMRINHAFCQFIPNSKFKAVIHKQ